MDEENDYLKLSIDERCQHKNWKARVSGYEDATKVFKQLPDEKSSEYTKYLGLLKKFVIDGNVAAQEKGLIAVLAFVENAACAPKTCGEVMNGIVAKCLGSPKAKTKELALEIILMYIEIERHEIVQEELLKGLENKSPKVVSACIVTLKEALRCFGFKVINLKLLIKLLGKLLEDRDKTVREETKLLTVEIYRWIKEAIRPQIQNLKPVQLTELEAEFAKVSGEKAAPTRFLRSQQEAQARQQAASSQGDQGDDGDQDKDDCQPDIDPFDLMEPVEILSKLPKDFYEKCEAKKWQERKEALEALLALASSPKLEGGDYGELVRTVKKMLSKDSNVLVVALAGRCIAGLAAGLRKKFQPYAGICFTAILEKFKEKKQNVVQALREAIDATYKTTTLEAVLEDIQGALDNKNPQIKLETASFVGRCLKLCTPAILNKKILKPLCVSLVKTLNDTDPNVRDASAEALGTAWKVVGERIITPFINESDALKMAKIKECSEKAVIQAPVSAPKKGGSKPPVQNVTEVTPSATDPEPVIKPAIQAFKKPPAKPPMKAATASSAKGIRKSASASLNKKTPDTPKAFNVSEKELSEEDVLSLLTDIVAPDVISGLSSSNWKERLTAVEKLTETTKTMDKEACPIQALVKLICKKPGLKDNNFQVLKLKLELIISLVDKVPISQCTVDSTLSDLVDKVGDPKTGSTVALVFSSLAESCSLEYIAQEVLQLSFTRRNPKNQVEALNWLSGAIKEFGLLVQVKTLIEYLKKAFGSTNPGVRTAGLSLLGTLYLYIGKTLRTFFEDEKPALLQQIDLELAKHQNSTPPTPTRNLLSRPAVSGGGGNHEGVMQQQTINISDLLPRVDISEQITGTLLGELGDKNWKVRAEAIQKVGAIISDAKFITPSLGDLPMTLKARLNDSNKNMVVQVLNLFQSLATALGAASSKHLRNVQPGLLTSLGDNKVTVRAAAVSAMNAWKDQCGLGPMFEDEMIAEALRNDNPSLKVELLGWVTEKLTDTKEITASDLSSCILPILSSLEDRNADVRKKAQESLLPVMLIVGFEPMAKATNKLKPASKTLIVKQLEILRPSLPAKPTQLAKPKSAPTRISSAAMTVASNDNAAEEDPAKGKINRSSSKSKLALKAKSAPPVNKKEEEDTSPPMVVNGMKDQRLIDEKSLKVLRWNFTTPREEFYHQLKEQMIAGGWSRTLIADCFHNDFKFHIKAIDIFTECLSSSLDATVSNLDLVLKWLAIRFFDTNPSVLIRSLEYLQQLFGALISSEYRLLEPEASSFIPYLVLKIGDPKDSVRKGVHEILKLMQNVYPASKLFSYIMHGLTSKNARQRAECLEELGAMIESCGMVVCQPSPSAAFKEIAKQIADRDNSVRNAALNCAVQAYFIEGEKVYKLVGNLTDKEMSLLEERIKRSARTKQVIATTETHVKPTPSVPEHHPQEVIHRSNKAAPSTPRPKSGPFSLDLDDIENMFKNKNKEKLPEPVDINADEILNLPDIQLPHTRLRPPASQVKLLNSSPEVTTALNLVMSQLAAQDIAVVVEAFAQVEEVLHQDYKVLDSRIDQLLLMGALQYRLTHTKHMADDTICKADIIKLYRCVTLTLVTLFDNKTLARKASRDVLRDLIPHLVTVMLDTRLNELQEGPQVVRAINILVVRILQRCNPTHVMSALTKLLHDSVGSLSATERYTELVMKCLWKMLRMMDQYIDELNIDRLLLDLHIFLKTYPSSFWKERPQDTPLRTVKTILYNLVKFKGEEIYKHLLLIPNRQESDLEVYLQKLINMQKDGMAKSPKEQPNNQSKKTKSTPVKLSKSTHESLAEIFKKIGSKDYTQEGLKELYKFTQDNPDADIEPFLQRSSEFFQDYIRRGLKDIEQVRPSQKPSSMEEETPAPHQSENNNNNSHPPTEGDSIFPRLPPNTIDTTTMDWVEWLKAIAACLGQDSKKYDDPEFISTLTSLPKEQCALKDTPFSEEEMQSINQNVDTMKLLVNQLKDKFEQDLSTNAN